MNFFRRLFHRHFYSCVLGINLPSDSHARHVIEEGLRENYPCRFTTTLVIFKVCNICGKRDISGGMDFITSMHGEMRLAINNWKMGFISTEELDACANKIGYTTSGIMELPKFKKR